MKILCLLSLMLLSACAVDMNAPKSNYARAGVYKDSIDHRYYNYLEAGKNVPVSKNGSVNVSVGLANEGSAEVVDLNKHIEDYWEVNYEHRW